MPLQIDAKKNFLVCNVIVAAMFMLGNLTLPSIFWVYHRISPTQLCLELFLAGVLASEVVIVGVYASFSRAFHFVRWACSIFSSIVYSLMLYKPEPKETICNNWSIDRFGYASACVSLPNVLFRKHVRVCQTLVRDSGFFSWLYLFAINRIPHVAVGWAAVCGAK